MTAEQHQQVRAMTSFYMVGFMQFINKTGIAVVKKGYNRSAAFLRLILMLTGLVNISYDVLNELTAAWL